MCGMGPSVKRRFLLSGWNKASLSLDASEEHDGYSSAEDPLNSDVEDDNGKTLVRRRQHVCISGTVATRVCEHDHN